MENSVYVIYVGVAGLRSEDVPHYVNEVTKKLIPESVSGEFIGIPTLSTSDTTIVCINPKYITEESLIIEHRQNMETLNELVQEEIKLKQEKIKE
jgi:hypothetical protein